MNGCVDGHVSCTPEPRSDHWYPTRLLDLGNPAQDGLTNLRLITTTSCSLEGYYTTLSHRWGQAEFLQLKRHNLQELHRNVPVAGLPQTFREAILASKALRIRYLWIDSLCIVQDDPSDWAYEASQMHMVYSNSHCNISASHGEDSTEGLFRDRNSHALCSTEVNFCTTNRLTTKARQAYVLANVVLMRKDIEGCPLNKRGWVLQERILAPRVLHFCRDQIFFECRTRIACELYSAGVPDDYYSPFFPDSIKTNGALRKKNKASWYEMWRNLVRAYSTMSLTYPSDKLAAISGVARMVQSAVHDEYVAGMWREGFLSQLLWIGTPTGVRPSVYRAPSWTWASVDGAIDFISNWFDDSKEEIDAEVVDLHVSYATEDKTGQVLGGWLDMKGSLRSVRLDKTTLAGEGREESWDMKFRDGDEGPHDIWAYLDDMSLEDIIIVQQSAAAEHFSMYVAKNHHLILRLADHENKLYERVGIAFDRSLPQFPILGKEPSRSLPCIRYEDGKHTIRII